MTTLEKGKFIKNFVRLNKNGKLVRVPHSNIKGYSTKDVEAIESKINSAYWESWEHYLRDLRQSDWQELYPDWAHFLFALNTIPDADIKNYDLPTSYIILEEKDIQVS